jgi:ribulose bisphosphate carboxylase small subunit
LWQAFLTLNAGRQVGMEVNAIALSDVLAYCELVGIDDPDERAELLTVVQRLDDAYLKYIRDHRKGGDS